MIYNREGVVVGMSDPMATTGEELITLRASVVWRWQPKTGCGTRWRSDPGLIAD